MIFENCIHLKLIASTPIDMCAVLTVHDFTSILFKPVADLRGGRRARDAPPPTQNFFIFMQFSGKIGQIIGWPPPLGLAPPPGKSWIRHCNCNRIQYTYLSVLVEMSFELRRCDATEQLSNTEVWRCGDWFRICNTRNLRVFYNGELGNDFSKLLFKTFGGHKGLFRCTVNVAVFVSGTFDLLNVMCKQYHRNTPNPF